MKNRRTSHQELQVSDGVKQDGNNAIREKATDKEYHALSPIIDEEILQDA